MEGTIGYIAISWKLMCKVWVEHVLGPNESKIYDKEHAKYFTNCVKILDIYDSKNKKSVDDISLSIDVQSKRSKLIKNEKDTTAYRVGDVVHAKDGSNFEFYLNEEVILNTRYSYYDDGSIKHVKESVEGATSTMTYHQNMLMIWSYNDCKKKILRKIHYDQEQRKRLIYHEVRCRGVRECYTLELNEDGTLRRSILKQGLFGDKWKQIRYDHGVETLGLVKEDGIITVHDLIQNCGFSTSDMREGFKTRIHIHCDEKIQVIYKHKDQYMIRTYDIDGTLMELSNLKKGNMRHRGTKKFYDVSS